MNNTLRMTELCRSMPYLADKDGFGGGWDPHIAFQLDQHERSADGEYPFPQWVNGSAAREAVRFARHVWNSSERPPSLLFWDRNHLHGFLVWARNPWWC